MLASSPRFPVAYSGKLNVAATQKRSYMNNRKLPWVRSITEYSMVINTCEKLPYCFRNNPCGFIISD